MIRTVRSNFVNNPGASSGALTYENKKKRSKLRGIKPGRQRLMKTAAARKPIKRPPLPGPLLLRRRGRDFILAASFFNSL
jgi:hypothetical protein